MSSTNRLNFFLVIINIIGGDTSGKFLVALLSFLFFFIYIYISFKAFFERQKIEREVGRTFFSRPAVATFGAKWMNQGN